MKTLVSVIIPTYNRCHYLGKTLDSILVQSFEEWECIVVDDQSQDRSTELLEFYTEKDSRIKYYKRPVSHPKGANSCRNYGFTKSIGKWIIWFDSDDLMTVDHIKLKYKAIVNRKLDFIVARTRNFKDDEFLEPYTYKIKSYGIKVEDFVLLKIHWYTYDVFLKREVAEKITWNQHLRAWQDYNYYCKMLLITENGEYIPDILTLRRLHSESIQSGMKENQGKFWVELLEVRFLTFNEISVKLNNSTRFILLHGIMNLCYDLIKLKIIPPYFLKILGLVLSTFGWKSSFLFSLSLISAFLSGKGNILLEASKKREQLVAI